MNRLCLPLSWVNIFWALFSSASYGKGREENLRGWSSLRRLKTEIPRPSMSKIRATLTILQPAWKLLRHNNINSLLIQAKREVKIERPDKDPSTASDYC